MTKQTQPRTITRVVYQLEKLVPGSFAHTELTSLSAPVEDYNPEKGLKSSFSARTRPTLYRMLLVSGLGSTSPRPLDRYLTQDEESEKLKAILSRYTFKNLLDS